jgi:LacI family transcriptional regulator
MAKKAQTNIPLRKVTITDVAALAGVSVGTVSNVINNRAHVTEARREKVKSAIEALSFTGSLIAKGMRTQRYPMVGLCVPNATSSNFVAMADRLEEQAAAANYELVEMITRHDPIREAIRVERLIASRASGIILLPTRRADPVLKLLRDAGMPTVIINRFAPGASDFDQVQVNHRSVFRQAARELAGRGLRTFLVATQFPSFSVVQENIAGIREGLKSTPDASVIILKCGRSRESYHEALAAQFAGGTKGTVIIANSSLLAAWSIEALRTLGLRCPEDVSLLAAEEPVWPLATSPTLSCIEQPTVELVRATWDLLARRMRGEADSAVTVRCESRLHLRGSVIGP